MGKECVFRVLDNSGALLVKCIGMLGGKSSIMQGDIIVCSILSVGSRARVRKHQVVHAVVLHCDKVIFRGSGFGFRFLKRGVALLDSKGSPLGTRIRGILPKELGTVSNKILYLADRIL